MTTAKEGPNTKPNKLGEAVMEILAPKVGAIVAQAMLEKQCAAIGLSPASLRKDNLTALAQRIEHVLVIFGHDEKELGNRIRALQDLTI